MLGKTRHDPQPEYEQRYDERAGPPRGVLQRPAPAGKFKHFRMATSPELGHWISHCWMAAWEMEPGKHHIAETLPHPSFHLVLENDEWTLAGVHTGKFTRRLEGSSFAFGVKFLPGGFHAFLKGPAASLADKIVPAKEIFGTAICDVLRKPSSREPWPEDEMVQQSCEFLLAQKPEFDPAIMKVNAIVEDILRRPELTTVDKLADATGLSERALQRLFHEYVGATPKWVIRRYRLHELVERCHSGQELDFAQVAVDLGYFDQAHLINDFRSIVGYTPAQYQKTAAKAKPKAARRV